MVTFVFALFNFCLSTTLFNHFTNTIILSTYVFVTCLQEQTHRIHLDPLDVFILIYIKKEPFYEGDFG